jgi:chromosome segregation ATPase
MTVTREEFTPWQRRTEARLATLETVSDEHVDKIGSQRGSLDAIHSDFGEMRQQFLIQKGMLQTLHLTQNDHTAALRGLRTGQDELRLGQEGLRRELTEMRVELTETRVGVQTIIDLLNSAGEEESGGSSPN